MRLNQLNEGVRYGNKQKDEVLKNLNNFGFGFEIELNYGENNSEFDFEENSAEHYIDELVHSRGAIVDPSDHDNLAEAISDNLSFGLNSSILKSLNLVMGSNLKELERITSISPTVDMFPTEKTHGILQELNDMANEIHENANIMKILRVLNLLENQPSATMILSSIVHEDIEDDQLDSITIAALDDFGEDVYELNNLLYTMIISSTSLNSLFNEAKLIPMDTLDDDQLQALKVWGNEITDSMNKINTLTNSMIESSVYNDEMLIEKVNDSSYITAAIEKIIELVIGDDDIDIHELLDKIDPYMEGTEHHYIIDSLVRGESPIIADLTNEVRTAEANSESIDFETYWDDQLEYMPDYVSDFEYRIEKEADGQIEIILEEPVSGKDILKAYKAMCAIIDHFIDNGFNAKSNSGLHMSISYKGNDGEMNKTKFIVLSDIFELTEGDDSMKRQYVDSIYKLVSSREEVDLLINAIIEDKNESTLYKDVIEYMESNLTSITKGLDAKYHSVNFNGFYTQEGRIELRFFGGDDYNEKTSDYLNILMKFMYVLMIAREDTHTKEYQQTMIRTLNKILVKSIIGLDVLSIRDNARAVERIVAKEPRLRRKDTVMDYLNDILGKELSEKDRTSLSMLSSDIAMTSIHQLWRIKHNTPEALKILIKHMNSK